MKGLRLRYVFKGENGHFGLDFWWPGAGRRFWERIWESGGVI